MYQYIFLLMLYELIYLFINVNIQVFSYDKVIYFDISQTFVIN